MSAAGLWFDHSGSTTLHLAFEWGRAPGRRAIGGHRSGLSAGSGGATSAGRPRRRFATKPRLLAALAVVLAVGCATTQTAKLSQAAAEKVALTRAPGGTVKESELEKEHGRLAWSFDIAMPGTNDITEVQVDAVTGEVVSVEEETVERAVLFEKLLLKDPTRGRE